ncbi:MAG: SBBP repeat-containing protein, partial [Thermoplasmata archaeon]|nr:SBBP repeat-containing protein [Thermoplasmata archaeon]
MRKFVCIVAVFILISSVSIVLTTPGSSQSVISEQDTNIEELTENMDINKVKILKNLNSINGFFTENQGQINDEAVRFYIRGKGIWFLDNCVVFDLQEPLEVAGPENALQSNLRRNFETDLANSGPRKGVIMKLNFEGANEVSPEGNYMLPHESNFFLGNDPTKWCTNVPNYREIIYKEIYDNIDLKYYETSNGLKYDFIVHPGGTPSDIRLSYEGIQDLFVDPYGDFRIKTELGDVIDSGMVVYQNINNVETNLESKFVLLGSDTFGFEIIDDYDHNQDLVIDPLVYSTYLGSSDYDVGYEVDVDSNDNAYVTGYTGSSDFDDTTLGAYDEAHNGGHDVFLTKLNPTGTSLLYSTFIGGSSSDEGRDLVIDSSGNIYICGVTSSNNFPTTSNAYDEVYNLNQDGFVVKLNPAGTGLNDLKYSSYLGGNSLDYCHSIDIDSSNRIYVAGDTQSTNFPNTTTSFQNKHNGGWIDGFFAKINPVNSGTFDLVYGTYLGGSTAPSFQAQDMAYGIRADSSGNAYITGVTYANNFPTTAGAYSTSLSSYSDAFITKINPAGGGPSDLLYSTYIGGTTSYDEAHGIAIDSSNNAYIVGRTDSNSFPTTVNAFDTSFNT